jgi:CheY-like chemotaxis protein
MGQAQQGRAVLIVEDDPELRSLTAALLQGEQVDVIECESAEAALATLLIGERKADPWVIGIRRRRPPLVVAVALANKTARIAWAVMLRQEQYQPRALAALPESSASAPLRTP